MAKKIQKNYDISDACADLCYVGKMGVCNFDDADVAGKSCVSLVVHQKKKKAYGLQGDMDFAKYSMKQLGFKDIFGDGMDGVMAIADIVVEYDISKKPYTIKNADLQEMKSLKEVMDHSRAKVHITRDEPDFEEVPAAEFKQAVANYIAQNQK